MNKILANSVVIRFAGDSGDGIQLIGQQLLEISVISSGNDVYSFVEFPSEIRAPAGSISGVSSFQLTISDRKVFNAADKIDLLFAFNPSALKLHLNSLKVDGVLLVDSDSFTDKNFKKSGYLDNPLFGELSFKFKIINIPITSLTYECVKNVIGTVSKAKRCKNFFALGVVCWIYDRNIDGIVIWLKKKFGDTDLFLANEMALKAGYNYCFNVELLSNQFYIPSVDLYTKSDKLVKNSGNRAFALGAIASAFLFRLPLFSANYPITPASDVFHELFRYVGKNIRIFQFEDELAAIGAVIGAAYGGVLGLTCTSGPGLDLMQEGLGLAIMSELPIVLLDIQRCGPSTGIPTKSEQTDLLAALFGRHGESGLIVLAPTSPNDCFWTIIEGFCLAMFSLSPVIILSDSNLANSSELWKVPSISEIRDRFVAFFDYFSIKISDDLNIDFDLVNFIWDVPGFSKDIFCSGGLERDLKTGSVSHDGDNHFLMIKNRLKKLELLVNYIDDIDLVGPIDGELLVITWGSVCGLIKSIYYDLLADGVIFSFICLRHLNPFPKNLEKIIMSFKNIIVVEENMGHLAFLLKASYSVNFSKINQVTGRPFDISFVKEKILSML